MEDRADMWQQDMLQMADERRYVDSPEMAAFVKRLRGQATFTSVEVAGLLGYSSTEQVFWLVEEGKLTATKRETKDSERRSLVFDRISLVIYKHKLMKEG